MRRPPSVLVSIGLTLLLPLAIRAAGESQRVVDQRGKTFEFPKPAERVVTIAIPLFWTFMTIDGSAGRLVGANPVATAQMRSGILEHVFPGATQVPTNIVRGGTFTPNIEALLALKPDAVLPSAGIVASASVFGLLALIAVFALSRLNSGSGRDGLSIVLAGVIVSAFFSALVGVAEVVADPERELPSIGCLAALQRPPHARPSSSA